MIKQRRKINFSDKKTSQTLRPGRGAGPNISRFNIQGDKSGSNREIRSDKIRGILKFNDATPSSKTKISRQKKVKSSNKMMNRTSYAKLEGLSETESSNSSDSTPCSMSKEGEEEEEQNSDDD